MLNTKIIKWLFDPEDSVKYTLPCKPGDTVLVIAPHPDDETLGCGGIIAQMLRNDITVAVLIVTDGNGGGRMPNIKKIRMKEYECAKTVLGFTKDFRLSFPDGSLYLYEDEFCEKISGILKKNSFSLIFVPYLLDYNSDHQAVNRVLAKSLIRVDYPLVKIAMYEIWTPIIYPNCLVNVSLEYEIKKRRFAVTVLRKAIMEFMRRRLRLMHLGLSFPCANKLTIWNVLSCWILKIMRRRPCPICFD